MLNSTKILGVKITTNSEEEILKYVVSELDKPADKREKVIIFTPNPEQITAAVRDPELASLLNKADIALPDGVGLVIGAKLIGEAVPARITGVDFMEKLLSMVSASARAGRDGSKRPVIAGFFGGQKGVAVEAGNCLRKTYQNLTVGYASSAYDKDEMGKSNIEILFVGLGFPKQEKWILEHKDEIGASVIMAVGGSLDFISGRVARAPKLVQSVGLEWLFRLAIQPWRFRRQARLLNFGGLILQSWVSDRFKK